MSQQPWLQDHYLHAGQSVQEKVDLLRTLGAKVPVVPTVPTPMTRTSKTAGRFAATLDNAIWANQFDNTANSLFHYESTGRNLVTTRVDVFTPARGTGGTLAGTSAT